MEVGILPIHMVMYEAACLLTVLTAMIRMTHGTKANTLL